MKGQGQGSDVGQVDYSLARRAVLRDLKTGLVSRMDVCDAHPDLLRAASYSGHPTSERCPVCEAGRLVLVSYVFSDGLSKRENGQVWTSDDITPLLELPEARLYRVEVCPDCSWNHVRSQLLLRPTRRRRGERRGRRATT